MSSGSRRCGIVEIQKLIPTRNIGIGSFEKELSQKSITEKLHASVMKQFFLSERISDEKSGFQRKCREIFLRQVFSSKEV